MTKTCEEALQELVVVNLDVCSVDELTQGGQIINLDDEEFWTYTLCPGAINGTSILPSVNLTVSQIAVAFRSIAGCPDVLEVTKPAATCQTDGTLLLSLLVNDPTIDCSTKCRSVNFFHHAIQVPAGVEVNIQANYTENCDDTMQEKTSFGFRQEGGFISLPCCLLLLMTLIMLRR